MTLPDRIIDESQLPRPIRLFTTRAIDVGAAIGGPLAASYLIASNFRAMKQPSYAQNSLVVGALFTIFLLPLLALLPESGASKILDPVLPVIIILAVHWMVKHSQAKAIDAHLTAGGQKGKGTSVAVVGFIGMLITLTYGFILWNLKTPPFEPCRVPKENASLILQKSGCTIYYDSTSVKAEDARQIGGLLENLGYCDSRTKAEAAFKKRGGIYSIELGISDEYWENAEIVSAARDLIRSLELSH
jgi:hypothetical protein